MPPESPRGSTGAPVPRRRLAAALVARLTHGHERHGARWHLHAATPEDEAEGLRRLIATLALPTFGLAFAISVLTTYGPVVLSRFTSSTTEIGLLIGGEGAFALFVPVVAGVLSDRLRPSRFGRRLPFVLVGAPLVVASLAALPFTASYGVAAAVVFAFFVGYFLYYPPYRALYADLVPRDHYGRALSGQAVARGAGLGAALLAGGLLLGAWQPLPFLIGAVAVVATTVALARLPAPRGGGGGDVLPYAAESLRALLRNHRELRAYAAANFLWELSFAGLKSFIVLYVVRGLDRSPSVASAVIAVVAVAYVVAAPLAGALADRVGIFRVLRGAALVYGCGLAVGVLPTTLLPMLTGLPFIALAGAVLMTLPTALAFTVAPLESAGAAAGLQDVSRGLGVVLGPILVGAVIDLSRGSLAATHGYAAMWPAIALPVLLSLLFIRPMEEGAAGSSGTGLLGR